MGNVIQIDDGSKVYDITNMRGELLGQFKFIPSDFDLIRRYDETVSAFEQMSEEIKGKKDAPISYVMELDKRIGEQVDYLFNAPVAKSFFSITSPFTMLDSGQFFVENVLNAVKGIIEQERNVKLEEVQAHVKKYTQKYKAGPGGYIAPVK